jgi:dihydrofolate reductase
MRRVRYGVGMSLDGFIADGEGGTSFLVSDPTYDAAPFFASIDTVLMGRRTYLEAVRQGMRAYPGLRNYVFSRTLDPRDFPEVTIVGADAEATVADLRSGAGKDIWLCGGGELFRSLLVAGLVDTVELGVSPVLLGRRGTPFLVLELPLERSVRLDLTRHEALPSGLLVLEYAVRRPGRPRKPGRRTRGVEASG